MKNNGGKVKKTRSGFTMSSSYEIEYDVINTKRPFYDPRDGSLVRAVGRRPCLLVTDEKVWDLYGRRICRYCKKHELDVLGFIQNSGRESDKTPEERERLHREVAARKLPRNGVLVAVGGGVVLDIVGCVAAEAYRGISFIRVPTTLIGIVDVSVGIKQGVNLGDAKNRLGHFWPAEFNICSPTLLKSLDSAALAAGCAEILKMGLIRDPYLFDLVERFGNQLIASGFQEPKSVARQIIQRAQYTMMQELAPNLFERDRRRAVDLGHTFSQAIEARSGYTIPHGHAVAIDMLYSTRIAVRRGLSHFGVLDRLVRVYEAVGLPCDQQVCGVQELGQSLAAARRHRGHLNLVVPVRVGRVTFLQDVVESELAEAVGYFRPLRVA